MSYEEINQKIKQLVKTDSSTTSYSLLQESSFQHSKYDLNPV